MTQPEGIDLGNSGWTNPEGFKPRQRDTAPAPVVAPTCGAKHTDGWECELKPGHSPIDRHWADDGMPGGFRWTQSMADVSTAADPGPVLIPGAVRMPDTALEEIAAIALAALENPSPSQWVLALDKILEVCRG